MKHDTQTVTMTAEEAALFHRFKESEAMKIEADRAHRERETYRNLVDEEIERTIPLLRAVSSGLRSAKEQVIQQFQTILQMKSQVMKLSRDEQRTHTFTNSEGDKRITLGMYHTDGYDDTADEGIAMVCRYLESLADEAKSKALVGMVLKLLSRDAKGTLKANRVLQLRRMAEESGSGLFIEGVRIIEESYRSAAGCQFIRAEIRGDDGGWITIPLGMTEA
ncbi:MAG: DUF3164 family protein [Rikenellaceae bacterium]|nr:DUF3164 family protein [Rikenellaceae bacterium]